MAMIIRTIFCIFLLLKERPRSLMLSMGLYLKVLWFSANLNEITAPKVALFAHACKIGSRLLIGNNNGFINFLHCT